MASVIVHRISKDEGAIKSKLDAVDWDFPGATTIENSVHSLHWFAGNFIPQIPSFLVQTLSSQGHLVLDPFCGSGTTGAESLALGRNAVLSDVSRIAVLISKAKSLILASPEIEPALRSVGELVGTRLDVGTDHGGAGGQGEAPELNKWYHPDTLSQLRGIWRIIEETEETAVSAVLQMLFSDTLFGSISPSPISARPGRRPRRHHWGWVADNVRPTTLAWRDARLAFLQRLSHALDVLRSVHSRPVSAGNTVVCRADSRSLPFDESVVDLIITSPPYIGMIDYTRGNRLTYLWHQWPLASDKVTEIGARYRRDRLREFESYLTAIETSVAEFSRVLKTGGYCAIVIGASRKFSEAPDSVIKAVTRYLRPVWGPVTRRPTRRRVSDRLGSDSQEFLSVFRKD
jgi:hypothetical protein